MQSVIGATTYVARLLVWTSKAVGVGRSEAEGSVSTHTNKKMTPRANSIGPQYSILMKKKEWLGLRRTSRPVPFSAMAIPRFRLRYTPRGQITAPASQKASSLGHPCA